MLFKIIIDVIIYFSLIYGSYYLLMSVFAFKKNKKKKIDGKTNYFAVLVAARNEEKVIVELIESLKRQNYDKNKFKIYVIINNCTDNTLELAKKSGASIIECNTSIKCKGDALKYAFKELKHDNKIDAYVIFDADNVVHPDFLKNMNYSINSGFKAAQGNRETKNLGKNWLTSSYAIYFYLQNFMFSRSRRNIKHSTIINGTGFMVTKELINTIGFNVKTLTEDIEFSCLCALNNIKIDYVEDAITYDEQPTNFIVSWHQRMRWTKGTLECFRLYSWKLIKNLFKTGNIINIDMLFLYLAPFVQTLSFLALMANTIIQLINIEMIQLYVFKNIVSLLISYLFGIIVSIFIILYNKHKLKDTLSGILSFFIFVFSWIPINIICIFKRKVDWNHIEHNANITINEVMKK